MTPSQRAERVILYGRVSSQHQADQYGLKTQLEACRDLAEKMGWEVVATYSDTISGVKITRNGLDQLREDIRLGRATAVVAYHLDRLNRDPAHHYLFVREMKNAGARIYYSSKGGRPVAETDDDEFIEGIEALVAFRERSRIRTRTLDARRKKARDGQLMGNGETCFGYRRVGDKGNYTWRIVEEEARTVRLIFEWYTSGVGVYQIVKRLTERSIPTPRDLRPGKSSQRKRGFGQWNSSTIYLLLRQSAYSGTAYTFRMQLDGETKTGGKKYSIRDKSQWFPFTVPAIVDPQIWKLAQTKLSVGKQKSARNTKYEYLLGRNLRCGECGSAVVGKPSYRGQYRYYYCVATRKDGIADKTCTLPAVRVELVDEDCWNWITGVLLDEAQLRERTSSNIEGLQIARDINETRRLEVAAHLTDISLSRKRLRHLFTSGRITEIEFDEDEAELDQKESIFRIDMAELDAELEALETPEQFEERLDEITELRGQAEGANFLGRRALVERAEIKAVLFRGEGHFCVEYVSTFFLIRDRRKLYVLSPKI